MTSLERLLADLSRRPRHSCGSSATSSTAGRARSTCCGGRRATRAVRHGARQPRPAPARARGRRREGEEARHARRRARRAGSRRADRLAARAAVRASRTAATRWSTPGSTRGGRSRTRCASPARLRASCAGPSWRDFLAAILGTAGPPPRRGARRSPGPSAGAPRSRTSCARGCSSPTAASSPTSTARPPARRRARAVVRMPALAWATHTVVFGHWAALGRRSGRTTSGSTPAACGAT